MVRPLAICLAMIGLLAAGWLLGGCRGPAATPTPTVPPTPAILLASPSPARATPAAVTSSPTTTPSPTPSAGRPEQATASGQATEQLTMTPTAEIPMTITIVYDNIAYRPDLTAAWGFAAVITYGDQTLLFDTGGDGATLLANMATLGIDPQTIEHVVLSHAHSDHTGGLPGLLTTGAQPTIHLLPSLPAAFKQQLAVQTKVVETTAGAPVTAGVYVTGEVPGTLPEQALVIVTGRGLVVITGCAHPGVDRMVAQARTLFDEPVYLVVGGFHLGSTSTAAINHVVSELRAMGVQKVAPCHCTGEQAIAAFAAEYGEDFVEAGAGRVIVVQP